MEKNPGSAERVLQKMNITTSYHYTYISKRFLYFFMFTYIRKIRITYTKTYKLLLLSKRQKHNSLEFKILQLNRNSVLFQCSKFSAVTYVRTCIQNLIHNINAMTGF